MKSLVMTTGHSIFVDSVLYRIKKFITSLKSDRVTTKCNKRRIHELLNVRARG